MAPPVFVGLVRLLTGAARRNSRDTTRRGPRSVAPRLLKVMRMRRHGFTLIELLVVVAIITLLIAILMPALSRARETALLTVCASRQHQICTGTFSYATDHFGALPTRLGTSNLLSFNHWSRWFLVNSAPWNLGYVYSTGHITEGQVFFCPSQPDIGFAWTTYSTPSFPNPNARPHGWGPGVRLSYNYNPVTLSSSNRNRKYNAVSTVDSNTILLMDLVEFDFSINHLSLNAWNVAGGDGAVHTVVDPTIAEDIAADPGGVAGSNYVLFDSILDRLR